MECKGCRDKSTIIKNLTKKLRDATKNDGTGGSLESLLKEKRVRRYKFLGYGPGEIGQEIVEDEIVMKVPEVVENDEIRAAFWEWKELCLTSDKAMGMLKEFACMENQVRYEKLAEAELVAFDKLMRLYVKGSE